MRNGICVRLDNGAGSRWFGVATFAAAAALTECGPGEIVSFSHMTEQEYVTPAVGEAL